MWQQTQYFFNINENSYTLYFNLVPQNNIDKSLCIGQSHKCGSLDQEQ